MAKFQAAVDIWAIDQQARQRLQIGQWVYAGDRSNLGRWYGTNGKTDVVAWLGNARAWKGKSGGVWGYFATIRAYGRSITNLHRVALRLQQGRRAPLTAC